MNRTKRAILIVVIILNILNAGINIFFSVYSLINSQINDAVILYVCYDFISVLGCLAGAGLLIYAIANGGRYFNRRNGYYMAAVVISLCMNLFSVSSVLLFITLFMSDIVWVKPVDDVYFQEPKVDEEKTTDEKEKARKIAKLRAMRDNGEITEEEFKDELLKLL